jgi:hypothetical protein
MTAPLTLLPLTRSCCHGDTLVAKAASSWDCAARTRCGENLNLRFGRPDIQAMRPRRAPRSPLDRTVLRDRAHRLSDDPRPPAAGRRPPAPPLRDAAAGWQSEVGSQGLPRALRLALSLLWLPPLPWLAWLAGMVVPKSRAEGTGPGPRRPATRRAPRARRRHRGPCGERSRGSPCRSRSRGSSVSTEDTVGAVLGEA